VAAWPTIVPDEERVERLISARQAAFLHVALWHGAEHAHRMTSRHRSKRVDIRSNARAHSGATCQKRYARPCEAFHPSARTVLDH
jgi:hypothetical protein